MHAARERQAHPARDGALLGRPPGRDGTLDLEKAGLAGRRARPDRRSTSTTAPTGRHIYAVGDVIGFPSLAATSMEQGRLAALPGVRRRRRARSTTLLPIGIYTIPEISFVGRTEEELTEAGVPYEIGISRYRELARGQIVGDSHGMLKLLVSPDDRKLLGVHVFGTGATELVHIGQAVMAQRRHGRLPRRHGLQLPDAGRGATRSRRSTRRIG